MKKKISKILEDKVILKRERRVIISDGANHEEEEESDDNEEEEYWDYEDGGQSMEELDRLEKLEEVGKALENLKTKPKGCLFQKWKVESTPEKIEQAKKEKLKPKKISIPSLCEEISLEELEPSKPTIKEVNSPFIIKDQLMDDLNLIKEKPKRKINKINIIDEFIPSNNIEFFNPNYLLELGLNKKIEKKFEIPKVIQFSPEISPVAPTTIQGDNKLEIKGTDNNLNLPKTEEPSIKLRQKVEKDIKVPKKKVEVPYESGKISLDRIVPSDPLEREINLPFIMKDQIMEEEGEGVNKKPERQINKINIVDQLQVSKSIDFYSPDYEYGTKLNKNLSLIPNLSNLSNELNLIKISQSEPIDEKTQSLKIKTPYETDEDILKNKKIIYLLKTDKNKDDLERNQKIYIIKEERKLIEEEIIYIEIEYEVTKYKYYKQTIYLKSEISEDLEDERITYLTKYDKNKQKVDDIQIIYIILEENIVDDELPLSKEVIKNKKITYLLKSDKNKDEIGKDKSIYIIKDEVDNQVMTEEIIYIEVIYEISKYKNYKKSVYLQTKKTKKTKKKGRKNITYLTKYDEKKQNIEMEENIYIILEELPLLDEILRNKKVIYLLKSDKNQKDIEKDKKIYMIQEEEIIYIEIEFEITKYKYYKKTIYLKSKDIEDDRITYLTKYDKNKQNIEEDEIIYIILEEIVVDDELPIDKEILKNKKMIYLLKSDKNRKELEKDKNIYIIKDETDKYAKTEEIIYIEIEYEITKYKYYKKNLYLKAKGILKKDIDENITYITKYYKNIRNINEEEYIYIILEDESRIKSKLPSINDILKEKKTIYLLKSDKNKENLEKNKKIYIIKEESEFIEEEIYIEIEYEITKYKYYKKTIYLKSKDIPKDISKEDREDGRITYLTKYNENQQSIEENEIIYIILEEELPIKELTRGKRIVYLLKSDKNKDEIEKNKSIYIIKDGIDASKYTEREVIYIEIIYEITKYKNYKQIPYIEAKEVSKKKGDEHITYLTKYDKKYIQNIDEEQIIYIILEEEDKINENLPLVKDIIKSKKEIYLLRSDKNKDEIKKEKNIYIIDDENNKTKEEIIYIEIIYEITKYKYYKQVKYVKSKKYSNDERLTYLTKYDESKQNIYDYEIIYIILEEEDTYDELPIDKESIKDKNIIYLLKSDKKKDDIEKGKNIYIIKDDDVNMPNKEEIIYIETTYEISKYKNYKKVIYYKSKRVSKKRKNKKITYLSKYEKNKINIEEEENIYIILEEELEEIIDNELPITYKKPIYLLRSDKNKDDIEKDKKIYMIRNEDEEESQYEEIIYTEIIYEITKYKNYKKKPYIKSKKYIENERITYLTKFDKNKQDIDEDENIYIVLEEGEESVDNELPLKYKKKIYLSKSDKTKDEIEKNKNIYIIKDDVNKETEEEIIYIEIIYDITKYKDYKQIPFIESKDISKALGEENITYLTKYNKNKQNIEENENIYIILEEEKANEKLPSVTDIIKEKKEIYLLKSDKKKDEIEKDKNIYIIKDESEMIEDEIIYTEIVYEIEKYKNYRKIKYIRSKDKRKKSKKDKRKTKY